jgi:hypothetical protein
MKVHKNSLHAKLYRFTYEKGLPPNLCPYFWKLVGAAIIFIPHFIFRLPVTIRQWIMKDKEFVGPNECLGISLVIWILLTFAVWYIIGQVNWFKAMFGCYSYSQGWANFGWGVNLFAIIITFFVLRHEYPEWFSSKGEYGEYQEKRPNIIVEFFKAKYHKYCPQLQWVEEESETV